MVGAEHNSTTQQNAKVETQTMLFPMVASAKSARSQPRSALRSQRTSKRLAKMPRHWRVPLPPSRKPRVRPAATDVHFVSGDNQKDERTGIFLHRNILQIRSPVFLAMLEVLEPQGASVGGTVARSNMAVTNPCSTLPKYSTWPGIESSCPSSWQP